MATALRPLAIVTGASSGIGRELAKLCLANGFDLIIAADEPDIYIAGDELRAAGARVEALRADLSTIEGVDALCRTASGMGRPVDVLVANAGRGLGHAFLDQDFQEVRKVLDTNVTGTIYLIHEVGRAMRARGKGRILITGSIAGLMPGTFNAVYNGTKAFIDSFAAAIRNELKDSGVSVTCLMPGATETEFFERADLADTKLGQSKKDDPADVAKTGFDAMMRGEASVVHGVGNKVRAAVSAVAPSSVMAEQHRKMTEQPRSK
ncbi:SDR family NAD(P)-dependent oxidoreductase [Pendulispora brunnea]|uniref:SDR family NAD(P)-dependent oxidoreductase n=1 Tax=Pendulispora brunnea TaxID=2905690 RepID=A0ABZ2KBR3_9BACT